MIINTLAFLLAAVNPVSAEEAALPEADLVFEEGMERDLPEEEIVALDDSLFGDLDSIEE